MYRLPIEYLNNITMGILKIVSIQQSNFILGIMDVPNCQNTLETFV